MDLEHRSDFQWTESVHKTLRTDRQTSQMHMLVDHVFTHTFGCLWWKYFLLMMLSDVQTLAPKVLKGSNEQFYCFVMHKNNFKSKFLQSLCVRTAARLYCMS